MTEQTAASLSSLFTEVGLDTAQPDALLQSLADVAELGAGEPPAPNAELAALLGGSSGLATVHSLPSRRAMRASEEALEARRHRARSRRGVAVVTALSVAGVLVAGTAAAAATDPGFRHAARITIVGAVGHLTGHSQQAVPAKPAPAHHPVVPPASPMSTVVPSVPSVSSPAAPSSAPSGAGTSPHGNSESEHSVSNSGSVPVPALPTPGWLLGHGHNNPNQGPSPAVPTHPVVPPVLHTPPASSHGGGQ